MRDSDVGGRKVYIATQMDDRWIEGLVWTGGLEERMPVCLCLSGKLSFSGGCSTLVWLRWQMLWSAGGRKGREGVAREVGGRAELTETMGGKIYRPWKERKKEIIGRKKREKGRRGALFVLEDNEEVSGDEGPGKKGRKKKMIDEKKRKRR